VPPTRRELLTNGRLMKLALRAEKVARAAVEAVAALCQFRLQRCIIYKWHPAPAGSLAARTNNLAA
jgi:hypothetical protein